MRELFMLELSIKRIRVRGSDGRRNISTVQHLSLGCCISQIWSCVHCHLKWIADGHVCVVSALSAPERSSDVAD